MLTIQLFIAIVLLGMSGILLSNWWLFPRLEGRDGEREAGPASVSFLVPARDEAAVIGETVRALLRQADATEVLVLDDHSGDGTAALARAAAAGDPRLRVLAGADLPAGWLGKNWACHQLAEAAQGKILVFTDADVQWQPGALAALRAEMARTDADLLTVWPTQRTVTLAERLVVPLMAFVIHAYLPVLCVHHTRFSLFAAANGQCMAFQRCAYQEIGGHACVRGNVLEDVTLARRTKAAGLQLRMAEGNELVACRMYGGWQEVRDGYAKNVLKGYGGAGGLLAATLFHWVVFLGPWLFLLLGLLGVEIPSWPWGALGLAAWGILLRAGTAYRSRQRIGDALLLPLSVLLMTYIAGQALRWQWRHGGPVWKGRMVRP